MAVTYDSIATNTLGSAASSVSITSIPNSYTDLKAVFVYRSSGNAGTNNIPVLSINGVTTGWSIVYNTGGATAPNGGSLTGKSGLWTTGGAYTANSTNWFFVEFNIMDYASTRMKTVDSRLCCAQTGGANQEVTIAAGYAPTSTSAITTITVSDPIFGNNYAANSTLSLFGIARA